MIIPPMPTPVAAESVTDLQALTEVLWLVAAASLVALLSATVKLGTAHVTGSDPGSYPFLAMVSGGVTTTSALTAVFIGSIATDLDWLPTALWSIAGGAVILTLAILLMKLLNRAASKVAARKAERIKIAPTPPTALQQLEAAADALSFMDPTWVAQNVTPWWLTDQAPELPELPELNQGTPTATVTVRAMDGNVVTQLEKL